MYKKKLPLQVGLTDRQKGLVESYGRQYGVSQAKIIREILDYVLEAPLVAAEIFESRFKKM